MIVAAYRPLRFTSGTANRRGGPFANDPKIAALAAAGFSRDELVSVDIAFTDLKDIGAVNGLFGELFPEGRRPARTVYQAAALPYGGKIKVQGVAVRQN